MKILNYTQLHNKYRYKITDLIEASKELEVYEIKVSDIYLGYYAPCLNTLVSFIEHYKDVEKADLSYPIIMSPDNMILDGKHRLAKAIITEQEYIKAVKFKIMPDCGIYEDNE